MTAVDRLRAAARSMATVPSRRLIATAVAIAAHAEGAAVAAVRNVPRGKFDDVDEATTTREATDAEDV